MSPNFITHSVASAMPKSTDGNYFPKFFSVLSYHRLIAAGDSD
jgi:hypothetical protein